MQEHSTLCLRPVVAHPALVTEEVRSALVPAIDWWLDASIDGYDDLATIVVVDHPLVDQHQALRLGNLALRMRSRRPCTGLGMTSPSN